MDEILVLGYPLILRFLDFLTAEKATVSSKAENRITPTRGSIAAVSDTLDKMELMLITAKIKGGNSGGPIINKQGSVVGVACNVPIYEDTGNYDDLGYGIAIPIKYLLEICNTDKPLKFKEKINFVNWEA